MSKGLQDLQATIQSYQTSSDAINQYISNYDKGFFDDWKAKVDLASDKLEAAQKVADGVGETYLGTKALSYTVKAFRNKYFNKDDKNPSDEDGKNEGNAGGNDDVDTSGGQNSSTGNSDDIPDDEPETLGDGTEVSDMSSGNYTAETDVSGQQGTELQDMNTNSQPASTNADGSAEETSFTEQSGANPTTTQDVQPEVEDFVENPPPSQEMSVMGQSSEPSVSSSGGSGVSDSGQTGLQQTDVQNLIQETDPEAGLTGETGGTTGGEIGGDIGGDIGADIGADIGGEVASGVGSAVLGGLGVAAEALGPIGLLAGVGIGLYELFHKPSKPPTPPKQITASSKGEMVLPTYDAVIDTPASASAF